MQTCLLLAHFSSPSSASDRLFFSSADLELERFLLGADVVGSKEIGTGITKPLKLTLTLDDRKGYAAFKSVSIQNVGITRFEKSGFTSNFTDDHKYERAAYLLDRILGINMVPVCVIRKIDGREGAVIDWVSDAIDESERREQDLKPPDPASLLYQKDVMRIFDVLISNSDRNLTNQLITTSDWKLHLIDHSRSFRLRKKVSSAFDDIPVSLPESLYQRLKQLDGPTLRELFDGLLSRAQVKALLSRRDQIIEKIDKDREKFGDSMVFQLKPRKTWHMERN